MHDPCKPSMDDYQFLRGKLQNAILWIAISLAGYYIIFRAFQFDDLSRKFHSDRLCRLRLQFNFYFVLIPIES